MEAVKQFIDGLGAGKYYILGFVGLMVLYLIGAIFYMKNKRKRAEDWEAAHPDGNQILIKNLALSQGQDGISVLSVNGALPQRFFKGLKRGIYLEPGTHTLEVSFTSTRPGVLYRTVSNTYGKIPIEVVTEPRKNYTLSFNKKAEKYEFEELAET